MNGKKSRASENPPPAAVRSQVPLSDLTTLELGGPADHLLEVVEIGQVAQALRWAADEGLPLSVLGGGSNVVVADRGFPGVVLRMGLLGIEIEQSLDAVILRAAAGEVWDEVVAFAVRENLAGLECLSGIPGTVGATPIQNVGAYGQEVAQVVHSVEVLDRQTFERTTLGAADCAFSYRGSRFRSQPDRFVILAVSFALARGGAATLTYPELQRVLGDPTTPPPLAAVREAVLELRRSKSMIVDVNDNNRRSVGSFFVNPVVGSDEAEQVAGRAVAAGVVGSAEEMPSHATLDGRSKLSAAWLVEHSGFARGSRRGPVGLSSNHALALVHHGGGTTAQLLDFAAEIIAGVHTRFGLTLRPEPVFLGFENGEPLASVHQAQGHSLA